jgi:hypothetical protein
VVTKDLNFILEGRFKIFFFHEKFLGSIGEEKIENIVLENNLVLLLVYM